MKKIIIFLMVFFLVSPLFSQEGFTDIFSDSETEDASEESSSASGIGLTVSGEAGFKHGFYFDNGWDSERITLPYANLLLQADTDDVQAKIRLSLDDDLSSSITLYDVVDELSLSAFFPFGYLEAGLMKVEWGKGDGIHVIDPLNPLDQRGGFSSDINELKRAEIMMKMNIYLGQNGLLEVVYKPFYHPYQTAASGRWMITDMSLIPRLQPPPDTETWEYTQAAARITGAFQSLDLGLIYYYGYMSEPGLKFTATTDIVYTKAQLIGAEAAAVLGPLTLRGEAGLWISEDLDGSEAHLYNNRLSWLAGVDMMIPGTTLFVSIQEFGYYITDFSTVNPVDVNQSLTYNGKAYSNTLVAAIEGTFFKEQLKVRLSGLYLFEANGFMIMPQVFWYITDDLELSLSGTIIGGDDTGKNPYYAWKDNDSICIELNYLF